MRAARIDGDMDHASRWAALQAFVDGGGGGAAVLLITLSTGGVGLNIEVANHGIFLDGWWNPAVLEQAIDRMHRIGQKHEARARPPPAARTRTCVLCDPAARATPIWATPQVRVLRLVTATPIEEKILATANEKLDQEAKVYSPLTTFPRACTPP